VNKDAAIIVGTASRKENSAAAVRPIPPHSPATMVKPLRDNPGNTANPWAKPTSKAAFQPTLNRDSGPLVGLMNRTEKSVAAVTTNIAPTKRGDAKAATI
jgi:hypothetical protein